jgi:hypothetical protein
MHVSCPHSFKQMILAVTWSKPEPCAYLTASSRKNFLQLKMPVNAHAEQRRGRSA